jgi:hypothetical protein
MIGQNRQAGFQQARPTTTSSHKNFLAQEQELHVNTALTREVHALTTAIHTQLVREPDRPTP